MTGLSVFEPILYLGILLLIAYKDSKNRMIPNKLLIGLLIFRTVFLACSFAVSIKNGTLVLLSSVGASVIALAALFLFQSFLKEKTAAGDFKLLIVCGFCFGIDLYLHSLLLALLFLVVALILQLVKKRQRSIPFAPFIFAAMLIAFILSYF